MAPSFDAAVQQFLDHLRVERELAPATVSAYGGDLADFAKFLAGRAVARARDVRSIDVLDYLARITEQGLSARSQARRLIALRQLFRFLRAEHACDTDPTEEIDLPRFGRKLPAFLSVEEVDQLLAAPDRRTPRGARDGAMLEVLYASGLRVSELVRLRLADVNFDAGYLMAFGKGRKQRLVPIGEVALAGLRAYLDTARATFLTGSGGKSRTKANGGVERAVPDAAWPSHEPAVVLEAARPLRPRGRHPQGDLAPQAAPFLRHPPGRARRRSARRAGDARTRGHRNDGDLHAPVTPAPA